jgi:hypothetical protein
MEPLLFASAIGTAILAFGWGIIIWKETHAGRNTGRPERVETGSQEQYAWEWGDHLKPRTVEAECKEEAAKPVLTSEVGTTRPVRLSPFIYRGITYNWSEPEGLSTRSTRLPERSEESGFSAANRIAESRIRALQSSPKPLDNMSAAEVAHAFSYLQDYLNEQVQQAEITGHYETTSIIDAPSFDGGCVSSD